MNPNPQNEVKTVPLMQKIENVQLLALFPALTLMVLLRKNLGFRLVKPNILFVMGIIMITVSSLSPLGGKTSLIIYAGVMVIAGLFQRRRHWNSIKLRKAPRHTRATGISYLDAEWMHPFFLEERRIYRFLDPLICFAIAIALAILKAEALAWWLAVSSLALFLFEGGYYEKMLNRILDIYDAMIEAAAQQETANSLSKQPKAAKKSLKQRGLPSGIGLDIVAQIEELKVAQSAGQAEVPATETSPVTSAKMANAPGFQKSLS